ncbi:MAG: hypothetical protein AAGA48_05275 [Myxococcota bacterium]
MPELERILAVHLHNDGPMHRVTYVRGYPILLGDLDELLIGKPCVHRFSMSIRGAMDAFSAELIGGARATGAVGGRSLLVTYATLGRRCIPGSQTHIERHFASRWGPILAVPSLREADAWFQRVMSFN